MKRWAGWVLRHRALIAGFWLLVAVAGAVISPTTAGRLTYEFALPGQPAYETNEHIVETYGGGGLTDPLLVVVSGDAVIVRGLLAPALVGVLGPPNWTLPGPLATVLGLRRGTRA